MQTGLHGKRVSSVDQFVCLCTNISLIVAVLKRARLQNRCVCMYVRQCMHPTRSIYIHTYVNMY